MGTYADAVRRKWDDQEQARQLKISALSQGLQNAQNPEQAQEILTGMVGILQPHEGHHIIGALRGLAGRLAGKHEQQQPMGTPPFVAPGTVQQPPAPKATPDDVPITQAGPGFTRPPVPNAPAPGGPQRPTPPGKPAPASAEPVQPSTAAQGRGPAPGGPKRPVPPQDPAIALFGKYWRSPAQLHQRDLQQKHDDFESELERAGITDPKDKQIFEQEFLRTEFGMKAPPGKPNYKNYILPDGKVVALDQNAEGFQPPAGSRLEAGSRHVPFNGGAVTPDRARDLLASGAVGEDEYKDVNGQTIDLAKLPDGVKLVPVYSGSGKYYQVADQKMRLVAADNQVLVEPEIGQMAAPGEAPSLGQKRVGTSRTTTVTAPSGQQVVTGTSVVAPVTPGARPATVPAAGATVPPVVSAPAPGGPARPIPPGAPARAAAPGKAASNIDAEIQTKGVMPDIQNMTPQNAKMAIKAQPAVTALYGLYGDPQRPEVKSLADFSDLANDKHAQETLGAAFALMDQQMGEITDPGVMATLATAAGWANFRAKAEAGAQQQAGSAMTAREREYFDIAISGMADIIGARAATGQSPAKFSVNAIQNELPLIGLSSTPDRQSYITKMQTIARQINVGLNAMPDNQRALYYLDKRVHDLEREKGKGKPAPGGPARPKPPAAGGGGATIKVSPEDLK